MNAKNKKALEMATAAYQGKKDSLGNDFIDHSINVSNRCRSINEKLVALFSGSLGRTNISIEDIRINFGSTVSDAVLALTRKKDEPFKEYLRRIKANPVARAVKLEDIKYRIDLDNNKKTDNLEIIMKWLNK